MAKPKKVDPPLTIPTKPPVPMPPVADTSVEADWAKWLEGAGRGKKYPISGSDMSDRAYDKPSGARTTPSGRYTAVPSRPKRGVKPNPFVTFDVEIFGARETLMTLTATLTGSIVAAEAALLASARRIQAQARQNVRPHKYEGRLHDAIQVSTSKRSKKAGMVRITVGIRGRVFVPEGATFERGWKSEKGLQPPTEPLAIWARRRGLASDDRAARRIGFVVARSMARKGYSFGTLPWLSSAYAMEAASIEPTVARYILSSWGAQKRGPGGRFLGG